MGFLELEAKIKQFYDAHKKLVVFGFALAIAIFMTADHAYFHGTVEHVLQWATLIEVILLVCFMILVAGAVVIRALFDVAVGLSLIIFLAQAYCASPIHTVNGDGALKTLIIFGLGYVAFDFASKLYHGIRDFFKSLQEAKWDIYKIIISVMFVTLAGVFVWDIYALMSPIILGLCVYHP